MRDRFKEQEAKAAALEKAAKKNKKKQKALNKKISSLAKKIQAEQPKLIALQKKNDALESTIDDQRDAQKALSSQQAQLVEKINSLKNDILQATKIRLKAQIDLIETQQTIEHADHELKEYHQQIKQQKSSIQKNSNQQIRLRQEGDTQQVIVRNALEHVTNNIDEAALASTALLVKNTMSSTYVERGDIERITSLEIQNKKTKKNKKSKPGKKKK